MICSLSYDKKKVNIQAQSWKYVIDMYNFMNISLPSNVKPNDRFYFDISNFSTEVSNVFILGMGQSIGDETLFFLMKDGTVEYMPIVDSIRNNSIKSYGKIKNVNDIVDIIQGDVGYVEGGGWASVFALKSDGSFYDLSPILRETGFYR